MERLTKLRAVIRQARYLHLRIVWRVMVPLAVWVAAPRLLTHEAASTVRDVAMTAILLALVAWTTRNGRRETVEATRGIGVLGVRKEDEVKEQSNGSL